MTVDFLKLILATSEINTFFFDSDFEPVYQLFSLVSELTKLTGQV